MHLSVAGESYCFRIILLTLFITESFQGIAFYTCTSYGCLCTHICTIIYKSVLYMYVYRYPFKTRNRAGKAFSKATWTSLFLVMVM